MQLTGHVAPQIPLVDVVPHLCISLPGIVIMPARSLVISKFFGGFSYTDHDPSMTGISLRALRAAFFSLDMSPLIEVKVTTGMITARATKRAPPPRRP